MSCPKCSAALQWWLKKEITVDLRTGKSDKTAPPEFAGACSVCRQVFCPEHARGNRCPMCGRALSITKPWSRYDNQEICWCGGRYTQVGGHHKLVMHEKDDPWEDPTGYLACADCGEPLKGNSSLVAHGPCVKLACERCGHELSNADSIAALQKQGYQIQG